MVRGFSEAQRRHDLETPYDNCERYLVTLTYSFEIDYDGDLEDDLQDEKLLSEFAHSWIDWGEPDELVVERI